MTDPNQAVAAALASVRLATSEASFLLEQALRRPDLSQLLIVRALETLEKAERAGSLMRLPSQRESVDP